jgi:hypothetical protein
MNEEDTMSHIENPTAYWNAVDGRIKARAFQKRRREWEQANPAAADIVADLWWPAVKPCCDNPEFVDLDYHDECANCGGDGTMNYQQDGSHLDLRTLTPKDRGVLLKRTGWLRDGYEKYGGLTPKQTVKLLEITEEVRTKTAKWDEQEAERIANAVPWTAGRQDAEVTLISAKLKEQPSFNPYDRYPTLTWKGVFQREDGSRVWCTIPGKLIDACGWRDKDAMAKSLRGATCVLTVTVEPKAGEPTFAFGKRPTILKKNEGSMALPNLTLDEEE